MQEILIYCDGASLNNGSPNAIASYGIVMIYKEMADELANNEAMNYAKRGGLSG
jgi:ribonuclease HI